MKLYNGNCNEVIKTLPDKSVDLIYTDVPYDIEGNRGGGCFGEKKRDYHAEYYKCSNNPEKYSGIAYRTASSSSIAEIAFGFDWNLLDEMIRVMKTIYIYISGVPRNKFPSYLITS